MILVSLPQRYIDLEWSFWEQNGTKDSLFYKHVVTLKSCEKQDYICKIILGI